jgi:glycine cleavage system aminomethyltransferase T
MLLVVGDIGGLKSNEGLLSLITNDNGGIIDDTVITNVLEMQKSSKIKSKPICEKKEMARKQEQKFTDLEAYLRGELVGHTKVNRDHQNI